MQNSMVIARASRSRLKKVVTNFDFILSLATLVMAPVQQECECSIWVICQIYENGETGLLEAHVSQESADAAKKDMRGIEVEVMELELKSIIDIDAPPKSKKRCVPLIICVCSILTPPPATSPAPIHRRRIRRKSRTPTMKAMTMEKVTHPIRTLHRRPKSTAMRYQTSRM